MRTKKVLEVYLKNKEKGFTLIELLAVIVILAIIALVAVPIVLNMIENSKKSAAKSSAYGYIDAIEYNNGFFQAEQTGYTEIIGDNLNVTSSTFDSLKVKGKRPTSGTVSIGTNGKVSSANLCIEGYIVIYNDNEVTSVSKGCSNSSAQQVLYKCKKATTLTSDGTHTFGTNTGSTLVPGYALDCKVSTTGGYTERFYYVTDLESNPNYAVLIYNNNTKVVNGTLSNDNTATFKYDSSGENWHGPQSTILDNLPTTTQWNNVGLSSPTRALTSATYDSGHVYATTTSSGSHALPTNFSYSGKAARLITYKEMVTACNQSSTKSPQSQNYLNNCTYFMENTTYSNTDNNIGYWLETPRSVSSGGVWIVDSDTARWMYVYSAEVGNIFGVRPVIEVLKSEINLN